MHLLSSMYHQSKIDSLLDKRDLNTRQLQKLKFKVMNPLVKKAFKSPNYLGSRLWDILPKETQVAGSFNVFKFRVKQHIAAGMFNNA